MDLALTDDQEQLVAVYRSFLARECPPARVRAAEPSGFDHALWLRLAALGGPTIGVATGAGGGGASLADLGLVCEQLGAVLAPAPFVEAVVTARALARCGPTAGPLLGRLTEVEPPVATLALRPTEAGVARLVPAGAVAEIVLALEGDELIADVSSPPLPGDGPPNLGAMPLADREIPRGSQRVVLARGPVAEDGYRRAVDEWRALTAASLVGLAGAALGIAVGYAKERHQFGVPIGSFQSIARDLADAATAVDGARLLAREAAWAEAAAPGRFPELATMAFQFAARTAQRTSASALHVHGGYGFMTEFDIQLYFRRAKAWALVLEDPRAETRHLADALFGPLGGF